MGDDKLQEAIKGLMSKDNLTNQVADTVAATMSDKYQKENIKPSAWTKIVMYKKAGGK